MFAVKKKMNGFVYNSLQHIDVSTPTVGFHKKKLHNVKSTI